MWGGVASTVGYALGFSAIAVIALHLSAVTIVCVMWEPIRRCGRGALPAFVAVSHACFICILIALVVVAIL